MRSQSWLVDMVHMNLLHDLLKAGSGCSGSGASIVVVLSPVATPVVVNLALACSPSEVQEIPPKEPSRKKSRPQAVKDEKSDPPNERTSDARPRLKSVRELCRGHPEVDGRDFHAIRVCSQSEHTPDTALMMDLTPLTHETHVWMDGLRKEVQRLKDRSNPDAVVATEQRASEAQSLADHLKAKLEEATQRWEMGLVRMGRVSMEYGYQLALARFRARYLDFGVEEDPFKELPEDTIVPIVTEQPFDDSPPPPEE
ncbi:hypothetical protein GW17_00025309 [Ensete ventricosum]|nr:hypothetical protein GW17_00025309 [Ensete ventricosum]